MALITELPSQPQNQPLHNPQTTTTTRPITRSTTVSLTKSPPPPKPASEPPLTVTPLLPAHHPRKTRKLTKKSTPSTALTICPPPAIPLPHVPRPLSYPSEVSKAITHLRATDPYLSRFISTHPTTLPKFDCFQPPFLALTKSIIYQQLNFKAGNTIFTRFISLCGGIQYVVPEVVKGLRMEELRGIGVSVRKGEYLNDLAGKYCNGILSDEKLMGLDDKSLFSLLTMVKGIGQWSVDMFLIFSLHRPDVLPVGDLGVRKGVQNLYGLEELPRPSQMEVLCEKWKPYRSVGSWYMWRLMEPEKVDAGRDVSGGDGSRLPYRVVETGKGASGVGIRLRSRLVETRNNNGI